MNLSRYLRLEDFEAEAAKRLPRPIFGYVSEAVEDNRSLRDNRDAFAQWGFLPRALADVSRRTTATTLFGREYAAPFGIAPMGISAMSAYRGDLVLAEAARRAQIPMVLSASALTAMEEVAAANPEAWFQAYLPGQPERIAALVDRVAGAGYSTFVITVDLPVGSNRENMMRAGFSLPLRPSARLAWDGLVRPRWLFGTFLRTLATRGMPHFENTLATRGAPVLSANADRDFGNRDHLDWKHLEAIRRQFKGRIVLKGILAREDARIARESGVEGIIVSNHGGRQLDGMVSPLRVLPEIADVAGDMVVMMDSGVRRGTDILKAFALGAKFVFVGRPFLYAAAVGGEAGVLRAIELLQAEVHRNLGLLGINAMTEMKSEHIRRIPGASA